MEDSVFNHSSTGLATSILDAIEILTDKKISEAKFDRTIQATILSCISNTKGEYKCKYQDSKFVAYAPNPDVTYDENALVYILIPGNDWDATKTILGTVDKLGVDYIASISNKEYFDPIGSNVIDGNYAFELNTWDGSYFKTLYDKSLGINLIGLNTDKITDYFKDPNSTCFYIQAEFKTDIEITQVLGHYGFKITTSRASKDGYKTYYLLSDEMEGEPRHFTTFSVQNNLIHPFLIETTPEGINDFGEIIKIEAFVDNYINEAGHTPDIQIRNIQLTALHELSEMNMTDGYLSIITPSGSVFYPRNNDIIPNLIKLVAKVRMNGIASEDSDIKYYWFRQDARVYGGSSLEHLYCPLTGVNTNGWACLNNSTIENGKRLWDPATKEWTLSPNDVVAKKMYYKCVAIYDNIVMEKEIVIQNKAANYDVTISSSQGFNFYQDEGETILTCNIDWGSATPSTDIVYCWGSFNSEGIFNSEPWGKDSDTIQAIDIIGFTKYFCTVYADNHYIGTAVAVLTNSETTVSGNYYLNIANSNQLFKYNEEGISPTSASEQFPQPIIPLEVEFYDNQGNQLSREAVLQASSIKWFIPKTDTMLVKPIISGYTPETYIDEITGIEYWVFENFYNLPFEIEDIFDYNAVYNQIKLMVVYSGNTYISQTNFGFTKEGNVGTNGTKYSCKIVPNSTAHFNLSRVWITEKSNGTWNFNFNYPPSQFPFKVLVYRNSELIFSGYETGTGSGIRFNIRWEIEDEENSFYSISNNYFVYNGFPNSISHPFNNILKATIDIEAEDGRILYAFLPISVTKILDASLDNYQIGLYSKDGIYSGFDQVIYNTDCENSLYNEVVPFAPAVYNQNHIDVTNDFTIVRSFIGSNLTVDNEQRVIPTDFYEGQSVENAVLYLSSNNFIIYVPIVFSINRYGLYALNAWDGTHIKINEEDGYIYAPQMGAGIKESDNTFSGVLLGKINIPNSNDKLGLMAYGHGQRTVWVDAYTGRTELGAGNGKIIFAPGGESCIYGGNYDPYEPTEGMCINLNEPSIKWGNSNFEVDSEGLIKSIKVRLFEPNDEDYYFNLSKAGFLLDIGNGDYTYEDPNLHIDPFDEEYEDTPQYRRFVFMNSSVDPESSQVASGKTNAIAEFSSSGVLLQNLTTQSYLKMKDAESGTSNRPGTVALKAGNSLYLESGIMEIDPDSEDTSAGSVNIKSTYNVNLYGGHGMTIGVSTMNDDGTGYRPAPYLDDTYGYLKITSQYGWIYMSKAAGGKKNTPGIGINAYKANDSHRVDPPDWPYEGKDYKVYINGNEILTTGNVADATRGDLGGAVYVSDFGNLRPYLDHLVSLGSYYEEGDGIAAWRHVVTYDTIQVSDRREKEDIEDMDTRYVKFIMNLKPKRYHYKKTGDKEYRTGFIAQDVELDLNDVGLTNEEFGGLKKKPIMMYNKMVDYGYGLNYDDFVAALVLTVQDLQKQINELKEKRHGT